MELVKLNRNGQVSIPVRMRKKLSLKGGDFLRAEEETSGKIILTPVTVAEKNVLQQKVESEGLDFKKYETEGVDISLIRSHLSLTPTERLKGNKKWLALIEQVHKHPENNQK